MIYVVRSLDRFLVGTKHRLTQWHGAKNTAISAWAVRIEEL